MNGARRQAQEKCEGVREPPFSEIRWPRVCDVPPTVELGDGPDSNCVSRTRSGSVNHGFGSATGATIKVIFRATGFRGYASTLYRGVGRQRWG
jgi:hypothetical protein